MSAHLTPPIHHSNRTEGNRDKQEQIDTEKGRKMTEGYCKTFSSNLALLFSTKHKKDTNISAEPGPQRIHGHMAVRLEQYILTFGGQGKRAVPESTHIIWMYNLYTEKWKKYEIPSTSEAPRKFFEGKSAVVIGSDAYMFDGRNFSKSR